MGVNGLEIFRERLQAFADRYVLIGGTACFLALDALGIEFRPTKDLDIVVYLDSNEDGFARALWTFIIDGGYTVREAHSGQRQFYRFTKPSTAGFPFMLELFSRAPDALPMAAGQRVAPVFTTVDPEADPVRLSAIIVDDVYYHWIRAGRIEVGSLSIVRADHLIPIKAKAWLDLSQRSRRQGGIDSKDITKHRNDVFRLYAILDPDYHIDVPALIQDDMQAFVQSMAVQDLALDHLGLTRAPIPEILAALARRYHVDAEREHGP